MIREELDRVLEHREDLPNFRDISPDQKHFSEGDKWKTFFSSPTASTLRRTRDAIRAPWLFSGGFPEPGRHFSPFLSPGVRIPAACGPDKGVVRGHLG